MQKDKRKEHKAPKSNPINKRQRTLITLGIVFVLTALLLALYPVISSVVNNIYKSDIITNYDEIVTELEDNEEEAMLAEAREYNTALVPGVSGTDSGGFTETYMQNAAEQYYDILNVRSDGMMGYVEVPKIGVYLPIYHGTSDTTLELGIGHVLGTSLPVGGVDTHAVLSGHSGMARDRMFSDLEDVSEGDIFYIHILHLTLAYQVCEINVILPEEVDSLIVERGRDIVSLVTCVPFGVNTHRLVVTGERIQYDEAMAVEETAEDTSRSINKWTWEYLKGVLIGLGVILLFLLLYFIVSTMVKRTKRKKTNASLEQKTPSGAKITNPKGDVGKKNLPKAKTVDAKEDPKE